HEASLFNNLREALRDQDPSPQMEHNQGRDFMDEFVACKEHELAEFEMTISDLEYLWYLHTV
ncbi:MAG: glutamine synthetase, partial [Marinobacter sp.]|nr:glutamine synthetase [Marinobacter sp.]